MPAKSKSQQRLFSMALAVRKGELKRSDVYKSVLDIVDSDMTNREIEDFTVLEGRRTKPLFEYIMESGLDKRYIIIHTVADDILDWLDGRPDCYRVHINFGGIGPRQKDIDNDNFIIPNNRMIIGKIKGLLAKYTDGTEITTYYVPAEYRSIEDLIDALESSKVCAIDLKQGMSYSND